MREERFILVLVIILTLSFISAGCEEGMVDINSASEEELIKIKHIGPSRAAQIVDLRPFESVDDLIRVKGIGEVYLKNIKEQELACVDNQDKEEDEDIEEQEEETEQEEVEEKPEEIIEESITPELIKLNPQVIKSEDDSESNKETNKGKYGIYGLVGLCILIVLLFFLGRRKKSEFE
jgi:competence ComEA-like helix-hairpin-helix protein